MVVILSFDDLVEENDLECDSYGSRIFIDWLSLEKPVEASILDLRAYMSVMDRLKISFYGLEQR